MPFSKSWLESEPDGAIVTVSELDNWIRDTKIAIRERLEDSLFLPGSFANAPVVNPAITGGGLTIPVIVEAVVNADRIAYIHNQSATGFGMRIQNDGPVANYALKVSDASGAGVFHSYGRPVVHLGPEGSSQITAILGGTATNSFVSIEGMNGTDNQAGIIMKAGSFGIVSMLYQTGGDGGMRLAWNYKEPYDVNGSFGNPAYPQIQTSWETDGALGVEYTRPLAITAGSYDSLPGKSWKLYPAGNPGVTVSGRKDKYIFMSVCEPGRGFDFGVETAGTGSGYGTRLRIDDSTNANPIYLWVSGALKQVTIDGSGFLKGV